MSRRRISPNQCSFRCPHCGFSFTDADFRRHMLGRARLLAEREVVSAGATEGSGPIECPLDDVERLRP